MEKIGRRNHTGLKTKAGPVKIVIADPHFLIRQGLKTILSTVKEHEIIEEYDNYQIIPEIAVQKPDVLIVGLNIQGVSAISLIHETLQKYHHTKVLVLDTNEDTSEIIQILKLGVHGYILKQCDQEEIIDAVKAIMSGKNFFCSNVIRLNKSNQEDCSGLPVEGHDEPIHLSERELEILELISHGLTNKEIADKKFISSHTVASHRKNLMKKFRAKNNVDLVISAIKENFITI